MPKFERRMRSLYDSVQKERGTKNDEQRGLEESADKQGDSALPTKRKKKYRFITVC